MELNLDIMLVAAVVGVLTALFARPARPLDQVFDELADYVDRHFAPGALQSLLEPRQPP